MNRLRRHMPEVRAIAARSPLDDRPDADLLDRFARYAEHAAFEVLLRRHAPVVFGVCRRMLSNPADADDAFQATFLVLIRRASHVRGERLGPWLYGVAVRVALKARSIAARNAARHTEATDMLPDPSGSSGAADWLPILDAELAAVPAKYREPMVLCELQGLTRSAAAKALGIREGTLSSRLSRGREMLRKRLLRHGTLLPAGGLTALLPAEGRGGAPAGLLARTAELGAGAAGAVPAGPARLTDEVVKGMFLAKLKAVGGAAVVVAVVAVGLLAASPAEVPQTANARASEIRPPAPAAAQAVAPPASDREMLQGLWTLDKFELGKGAPASLSRTGPGSGAGMLIRGDEWWSFHEKQPGPVWRSWVTLDTEKHPKWLDLRRNPPHESGSDAQHSIYEVSRDRLRLAYTLGPRPAEFSIGDDSPVIVYEYRRAEMPKAAPDPTLLGEWTFAPNQTFISEIGEKRIVMQPRAVVYDTHLFINVPSGAYSDGKVWIGGRYSVDRDKNPKWIDIELFSPLDQHQPKKIYGSYAETKDGWQLALSLNGKRAIRPLAMTTHRPGDDWLYYSFVHATKGESPPKK